MRSIERSISSSACRLRSACNGQSDSAERRSTLQRPCAAAVACAALFFFFFCLCAGGLCRECFCLLACSLLFSRREQTSMTDCPLKTHTLKRSLWRLAAGRTFPRSDVRNIVFQRFVPRASHVLVRCGGSCYSETIRGGRRRDTTAGLLPKM